MAKKMANAVLNWSYCLFILIFCQFQSGNGQCVSGLTGVNCTEPCSYRCKMNNNNLFCDQDTGRCSDGCTPGVWGDTCDKHCPESCSGPLPSPCDQDTAECSLGCMTGFYTKNCGKSCSSNCVGSECVETDSGFKCVSGCISGFTGLNCTMPCTNPHCAVCPTDGECQECKPRYFGKLCDHVCSTKTPRCAKCHRDTGQCLQCDANYFGSTCQSTCSNCTNGLCDINGRCKDGCILGNYGDYCGNSCPINCEKFGDENNNAVKCSRTNGLCSRGCVKGFYGDHCDSKCPINCPKMKDAPDGSEHECHQIDGSCLEGDCQNNQYGLFCDTPCSRNCDKDAYGGTSCDKQLGWCVYGCSKGFYGQNCEKMCPKFCKDGNCNRGTGDCNRGCEAKLYGSKCRTLCHVNCKPIPISEVDSVDLGKLDCSEKCHSGCQSGWTGQFCDTEMSVSKSSLVSSNMAVILMLCVLVYGFSYEFAAVNV